MGTSLRITLLQVPGLDLCFCKVLWRPEGQWSPNFLVAGTGAPMRLQCLMT